MFGTKLDLPVGAIEIIPGKGNIGNAFLNQFVVTLTSRTMSCTSTRSPTTAYAPHRRSPGHRSGGTGRTIVRTIAVGSDADKAGLKVGDTVTAVDGTPITTATRSARHRTSPSTITITTEAGDFDASVVEDFFTVK